MPGVFASAILSSFGAARAEAFAEAINTAAAIDHFLLAGVERVALRADVEVNVLAQSRASLEHRAAAASCSDDCVIGMNFRFHGLAL